MKGGKEQKEMRKKSKEELRKSRPEHAGENKKEKRTDQGTTTRLQKNR